MIGVEIIAIGNELLLGKTIDTNSAWLGQQLAAIGLAVRRVTRIADEGPIIRQTLEQALVENQIVLLTGGLGQTKDDITKKVLADFFNTPLAEHGPTLQHIEAIYALRGRVVNEVSRQGALLPEACTVLPNAVGLSPGMQFEAPGGQLVVSLPGVPHEMKYLMETHVFPVLRDRFVTDHVAHRTFCTAGVPESSMAIRLKEFEAQLPEVIQLAYNPSLSQLNLRLTLQCPRSEAVHWQAELERQIASLQTLLGADCFGHEDDTLERVLGRALQERGLWLATAESCTGGALAARVVSVPGSSAYFRGAVVAYDNAVKLAELGVSPEVLAAEGAVSEAVARAMAEGVRRKLNADVALSTTGVAGPDGGSEAKPVGTVWVGYADAQGSFARKYTFERDRMRNIERTVATALNVARVAVAGSPKTP